MFVLDFPALQHAMGTFNGQLWMQVHGCAALVSLPLRLPLIVSLDLSRYRSPQYTHSIYVVMAMAMVM